MKVGNHYGTFGQNNYEQPHSHHVTDCLHEENGKVPEGSINQNKAGNRAEFTNGVIYEKTGHTYDYAGKPEAAGKGRKWNLSMVKGFWDTLGEEGTENSRLFSNFSFKDNILPGIAGAASAFRVRVTGSLVSSFKGMRNRIKTEVSAALKRFGRGQEAFTALSDQKTSSHQKNLYSGAGNRKEELRTEHKEEKEMKPLVHSHLMDSYSKTGAYCQLNENLTYQKPGGKVQGRKEITETEKE